MAAMRTLLPIAYLVVVAIGFLCSGAGHGWGVLLLFVACFPWSLIFLLDSVPDTTVVWAAVLVAGPCQWFWIGAFLDRRARSKERKADSQTE